jgi:uncharacterized membrane protein
MSHLFSPYYYRLKSFWISLPEEHKMNLRRMTWLVLVVYFLISLYAVMAIGFKLPQLPFTTPISTLLAFGFAVLHAGQREGWRRAAALAAIVFLTGLAFESLGVATGWVYGPYHYSDALGPKFLGLVPYLIPLAWTMMIYPSMIMAEHILPGEWHGARRWLGAAALGAVIMTAWDVAMDPMMVNGGNWVWEVKGAYFGVPLQNFWGWWLTSFVAIGIYLAAAGRIHERPAGIPDRWAIGSYAITAGSIVWVDLLVGLGGPALAGLFAMLPWLVMGFYQPSPAQPVKAGKGW